MYTHIYIYLEYISFNIRTPILWCVFEIEEISFGAGEFLHPSRWAQRPPPPFFKDLWGLAWAPGTEDRCVVMKIANNRQGISVVHCRTSPVWFLSQVHRLYQEEPARKGIFASLPVASLGVSLSRAKRQFRPSWVTFLSGIVAEDKQQIVKGLIMDLLQRWSIEEQNEQLRRGQATWCDQSVVLRSFPATFIFMSLNQLRDISIL